MNVDLEKVMLINFDIFISSILLQTNKQHTLFFLNGRYCDHTDVLCSVQLQRCFHTIKHKAVTAFANVRWEESD